jgi:hypothetical protein
MKSLLVRLLALLWVSVMVSQAWGGTWTANQFAYKPQLGARGAEAKAKFDSGLDRIDARLGKEVWVGDPEYGPTLPDAVDAIADSPRILRVPAGTYAITSNLTIPANICLQVERGAVLSVADGKTLKIEGLIQAGPWQIFTCSGTGKVQLNNSLPQILADWWVSDPDNATTTTAEIKAAVDSVNHLTVNTVNPRAPVVLTKKSYEIANLSFDQSGGTYYNGLTLIGKPGAGNKGDTGSSVTLNVTGAGNNGILISGKYDASPNCLNFPTLENLTIKKAEYPGDDNGDYGLKLRYCQFIRLDNVVSVNFGGAGLSIQSCYFGSFDGYEAWTCYRGIEFIKSAYGSQYACTTMNIRDPIINGCKVLFYSNGNTQANFRGLTADDVHGVSATNYISTIGKSIRLNFTDCWFEGLAAGNYAISLGDGALYPKYNNLIFDHCQISAKNSSCMFTTEGDGTAQIRFKSTSIYYSDVGDSILYQDTVTVPNCTTSNSCLNVLDYNDGTFGATGGPKVFMSSPTTDPTYAPTRSASGFAVVQDKVSSWGSLFNLRFKDDSISVPNDYAMDGFWAGIDGARAPSYFIHHYYNNYVHISVASAIPSAQTCDTSTTTPYKLTNVTNFSTFCKGDLVVITGAGEDGGDLTTTIVYINWNGTTIIIKDPVQATLTGTAITLVGVKGAVRLNSSPDTGEPKEWICSVAGTPGTWVVGGQVGYRTHAGAPTETPYFIGEELLDTTNGKWYKAKGLTSGDWVTLN